MKALTIHSTKALTKTATMASLRFYTVEMSSSPGLRPCPSSPISLSLSSPRSHLLLNTTNKRLDSSRNCRTLRISCSSSSTVTDQTQQSSFNDAEMKLIDALIGIQGRGKSASPKQLKVCCNKKKKNKSFFVACF